MTTIHRTSCYSAKPRPGMKADVLAKPVPREFLGRARQFRDRVLAADAMTTAVLDRVYDPLALRARRNPRPRPELIAAASRTWALEMPDFGRLGVRRVRKLTQTLTISEARLCAGRLRKDGWVEGETDPGLGVTFVKLEVGESLCHLSTEVIATVGLHAVGRWFQRAGADNSEAALVADFGRLAGEYGRILDDHARCPSERRFLVRVPNGAWAGTLARRHSEATGKDERIISVSTFLP